MRIIHIDANGWRARFDDGFTADNVARVADALGVFWANKYAGRTVYIGFDSRQNAAEHAQLTAEIMATYGLDVYLSKEPVPTPVVAKAVAQYDRCVGAVVLTASESSSEWGGLLVRGSDGGPLSSTMLADVERLISGDPPASRAQFQGVNLSDAYEQALLTQVDTTAIATQAPLVVIDTLFGAASVIAPHVFARAGCEVIALHTTFDTNFGGLTPAAQAPWTDECIQEVVRRGAVCGLVFDGDGDRVALVDNCGRLVAPHDLVALLAAHITERHGASGRIVVTTASSARVRRQAQRLQREITSVPVGFERIYGELLEGDVALAAEEYGGVCVPSWLHERDGLFTGLLAIEMLVHEKCSLGELVDRFEHTVGPMEYRQCDVHLDAAQIQALRNVLPGLNPSCIAGQKPISVSHADGLRLQFRDDSWVMLRPARTQAVVRAYAEAASVAACDELLKAACELARTAG